MTVQLPTLRSKKTPEAPTATTIGLSSRGVRPWIAPPFLVVDIGAHSVKLIEVGSAGGSLQLRQAAMGALPGSGPRGPVEIATALKGLLASGKFHARRTVLIVSDTSATALRLHIPAMPARELREATKWTAQKELTFPLEEAVHGSVQVGQISTEATENELVVLFGAVKSAPVLTSLEALRMVRLQAVAVSITPLTFVSLVTAVEQSGPVGETTLFIDIGQETMTFAFFRGRTLQFARTVDLSLRGIEEGTLSRAGAEDGARNPSTQSGTASAVQMTDEAPPGTQPLISEIQKCMIYYQEHLPGGGQVSRVLLSGGGARPRNLAAYLAYNLEIPVELLNPFGTLPHASSLDTAGLGEMAPHFVPAIGAALGDVGINLIPPEIAARNRMALARFACRVAVAGLVTGLAILHTSYQAEIGQLEGEIAERRQIVQRVLPLLTELEQWEQVAKDAGPELTAVERLRTTHFLRVATYKALSQLTPAHVTLRDLKLQHSSLKVVGLVFADQEEAEGRLARYLDILSSSPFFTSVRLVSSREATEYATRAVTFEVELTWNEPWASPAPK